MSDKLHLQGIGNVKAIEASKLTAGMVTVWNYGYKSEVISVEPSKTGKTVTAMLKSMQDGITRQRRMPARRLVAIN